MEDHGFGSRAIFQFIIVEEL
ncbi:hypothetical protein CCACVL1_19169 [Corchorus capsularis]|uniref:Uncharacterized protein n=1 Tax=Corchorus capsularis TaxID=210143 RepID=A0A1R3HI17_COCAP|nr:hypothetical protein CCACVL1_19169 [Corchorus capsularis]